MNKKTFWGVATLIILLVGVISFVMLTRTTEPDIVVNDVPEETLDNIRKENNSQILSTQKPPDEPGFVWEWHGDHWHKMPIAEANSHDGPHNGPIKGDRGIHPSAPKRVIPIGTPVPPSPPPTYTGPLTYHEELLEKHPVKALILQTKERGHWSADWILPLPPEDEEAQALARTEYIEHYYESIGDTDNPIYQKALEEGSAMRRVIMTYPYGGRAMDLARITWPSLRDGSGNMVQWPSEYLGIESYGEQQEREAREGKSK